MLETYRHIWQPGEGTTLVLLHGTGGDAADMLRLGAAVAPGAAMLALEGDVSEGGAARFFRRRAEGVYDLEDLALRTERLDAFLAAAFAEYGIDPGRAVGIGYSNGANILATLAFRSPMRLPRLGLMHPLIPFEPAIAVGAEALEIRITAGRRDPICPPALTEQLEAAFARAGARVETLWHPGGHEIRAEEIGHIAGLAAAAAAA